jgi:hypothetical protein
MSRKSFSYISVANTSGTSGLVPLLPITLSYRQTVQISALVDSGASVNVLPYHVGIAVGANWQEQKTQLRLTGNLANYEARALLIKGTIENMTPIDLAFAWTQSDKVPVILGQTNFFMAYQICFFRSENRFEIATKDSE